MSRRRSARRAGRSVGALARLAFNESGAYLRQGALMCTRATVAATTLDSAHVRVFVHGLNADARVMRPMMRALEDDTPQITLSLAGDRVEDMAGGLARELGERAPNATLDLVGHSLGGLVLRWMMSGDFDATRVLRFITLGAPHHGSVLSRVMPGALMRQLRPGSPLLAQLHNTAFPTHVRALSIAAENDQLVRPHHNALLPFGESLILDRMGHGGLLMDRRAHDAVRRALAQPARVQPSVPATEPVSS